MRIGIGTHIGPFWIGQTLWRSKRRRPRAKYWTHSGCSVRHRTQDAANRCRSGR